jgi:hypothetical protein
MRLTLVKVQIRALIHALHLLIMKRAPRLRVERSAHEFTAPVGAIDDPHLRAERRFGQNISAS